MLYLSRFLKIAGIVCLLALVAIFFQFNIFVLQLADSWSPGTGWIAFLVLFLVEAAGFVCLGLAWMPRRSRLILRANPTPEEVDAFAGEMHRRLRENPLVRAQHLSINDPDFVPRAIDILDARADEIIRSDARKIFLGTALAQNGRLDALIVFVALARMVWRISKVYNQRPTPAEILSVYSTVSSTAFVAFSIDALDIPQTVTEAMNSLIPAVAPTMATTSVPFMGSVMHCFTKSILDGAANGLLAIRAGVLTKNAFRFTSLDEPNPRAVSSREIRSAMLTLSKECMTDITTGLKDQLKDLAGSVADNCVEKTVNTARTVATSVTDVASSAGTLVMRGGGAVADVVSNGVGSTAQAVSTAAETVSDVVGKTADSVSGAVNTAADTVSNTAAQAVSTVSRTADTVSNAVGRTADSVSSAVSRTADTVSNVVSSGTTAVLRTVHGGTAAARKVLHGAGGLLGHVLPGRRKAEAPAPVPQVPADELVALHLALLWSNGRLDGERLDSLLQLAADSRASAFFADLARQEPDLDRIVRPLAFWRGRDGEVLALMDELGLPDSAPARDWLCELGSVLGMGTRLAEHLAD